MILVTGATGTNGTEVARQLAAAGAPVRALVRDPAKALARLGPSVKCAVGDFTDSASLDAALAGVEKAFLLPPVDPGHVEMSARFIAAAKRAGVKHIVKLSAIGTALDSPMVLGRWHAQSEKLLADSGIAWTFLRPNSFMQNTLGLAGGIAAQGAFYQPAVDCRISHIDARDIAAVAVAALTHPGHEGKTYDLTGPHSLSFTDVAATLSTVLGKKVNYVPVSPEAFAGSLRSWGMPPWLIDSLLELYASFRAGNFAAVTTTVATITGRPARSFSEFASDHADTFRPH